MQATCTYHPSPAPRRQTKLERLAERLVDELRFVVALGLVTRLLQEPRAPFHGIVELGVGVRKYLETGRSGLWRLKEKDSWLYRDTCSSGCLFSPSSSSHLLPIHSRLSRQSVKKHSTRVKPYTDLRMQGTTASAGVIALDRWLIFRCQCQCQCTVCCMLCFKRHGSAAKTVNVNLTLNCIQIECM